MIANHVPSDTSTRHALPVVRSRPGQVLAVVISSDGWMTVQVHWNGKRNVLCHGRHICEHCKTRLPQYQFWVTCERLSDHAPGLLQVPAGCSEVLARLQRENESVFGRVCNLTRMGTRINSPVSLVTLGFQKVIRPVSEDELREHVERVFQEKVSCSTRPVE
jgi:hypothetical protein